MDDNCWYVCEAGDTLTDDQRAFLERVATGAFAWLASAVAVRPVAEPITLADLGACDDDQHVRLPSGASPLSPPIQPAHGASMSRLQRCRCPCAHKRRHSGKVTAPVVPVRGQI